MITAKEAKHLFYTSGTEVDAYLKDKVEPLVRKAAQSGDRSTVVDIDASPYYDSLDDKIPQFYILVANILKDLGYDARIEFYGETYIPRGLTDNNDSGPLYKNYGIVIKW